MTITLGMLAAIATFALAGGWGCAHVATACSGRRFSMPIAVVVCAALGAWAAMIMGWTLIFPMTLGLAWTLLTLAVIDVLAFRLPDILTLPLSGAGLLVSFILTNEIWSHVAGGVIGYCVFAFIGWAFVRVRGREGLGLGDAKLAAAAGAWLGWVPLPSVVLIACAGGFLWIAAMAIVKGRAALTERIPFGVALAIAIWVVWLYGPLEVLTGAT